MVVFCQFCSCFHEGCGRPGHVSVFFVDRSDFTAGHRQINFIKNEICFRRSQADQYIGDQCDPQTFSGEVIGGDLLIQTETYFRGKAEISADFHGMAVGDGIRTEKDKGFF